MTDATRMRANLVFIGLLSMLCQILVLREMAVTFFGVELIYIVAIAAWLMGTALGSLVGRGRSGERWIPSVFLTIAALLVVTVAFLRGFGILVGAVPGAYLPLLLQLLGVVGATMPMSAGFGFLFPAAAGAFAVRTQGSLAQAYGWESLGAVFGGLGVTLAFHLGLQDTTLCFLCMMVCAGCSAFARRPGLGFGWVIRWCVTAVLMAVALVGVLRTADVAVWTTSWTHGDVSKTRDTAYGRVTICKRLDQVVVYENGALVFENQGTAAEEFAQLCLLQHPRPESVLVLGGPFEDLVCHVAMYAPRRLDWVVLDTSLVSWVGSVMGPDDDWCVDDFSGRLIEGDGRKFVDGARGYDVICVASEEPESGRANRTFTREFFAACRAALNPGGILGFRLPSSENLWTTHLRRRNASIFTALNEVFPYVTVLPGTVDVFLASTTPLPDDPNHLARRLGDRVDDLDWVSLPYLNYVYTNERLGRVRELLETTAMPPNRDGAPICYPLTILIWLSKFFPRLSFWDPFPVISSPSFLLGSMTLAWISVLLVAALMRRSPSARRVTLVFLAALVCMVAEGILVLHYQTKCGVLYQDIGALLTAFMVGLVFGAWMIHAAGKRHLPAKTADPDASTAKFIRWRERGLGLGVVGILVATQAILAMGLVWDWFRTLVVIGVMLFAEGMCISACFGYAGLVHQRAGHAAVGPLYAADLLGGCVGGLLGVLLMVPLYGLVGASAGLIPLALTCVFLL